jgi:hypothetical protein
MALRVLLIFLAISMLNLDFMWSNRPHSQGKATFSSDAGVPLKRCADQVKKGQEHSEEKPQQPCKQ